MVTCVLFAVVSMDNTDADPSKKSAPSPLWKNCPGKALPQEHPLAARESVIRLQMTMREDVCVSTDMRGCVRRIPSHSYLLCQLPPCCDVEECERRNQDYSDFVLTAFTQFKPPKYIKDHDHNLDRGHDFRIMDLDVSKSRPHREKEHSVLMEHDQLMIRSD
ncbi:hypothetical protein JTE90_015463 [Oedothorax gibbosus]|uniref:Uncharacterized protein n=1 Tax=Oedothorax gibbosus TaxID=931172 RepID=A0AAV6UD70_9ARAC|nr:hypothetical protein JTE90_015463 [Oedothorax gibbosus]